MNLRLEWQDATNWHKNILKEFSQLHSDMLHNR